MNPSLLGLLIVIPLLFMACHYQKPVTKISEHKISGAPLEKVVDIPTRKGVSLRLHLVKTPKAAAWLVLLPGAHGRLDLDRSGNPAKLKNNFLVRSRRDLAAQGFCTALLDAPTDRQDQNGLLYGFRNSIEYAKDLQKVIDYLRTETKLPVWIIGTSRGSTGAAAVAQGDRLANLAGIVLSSSLTISNPKGPQLLELDLGSIKTPVLILHHKKDNCPYTPYNGATQVKARLNNTSHVELISFEKTRSALSNPCQARSAHGFWGNEKDVVLTSCRWIKRYSSKQ
jgi:dienelactone hydrolase